MAPAQNFAVKILELIGYTLWGFKPHMMAYFVLEYGAVSSLMWFIKNMPKYQRILKDWGPIRTHLVSTTLSTLQGCAYCTYGHAYALQLHYFKRAKRLFPMDEDALLTLHGLPDDDVFKQLSTALTSAGLTQEIELLDRLASLRTMSASEKSQAAQGNVNDHYLCHLMSMFSTLNVCAIKHQVAPDEAHDPINRDKALRARYAALRSEQGPNNT